MPFAPLARSAFRDASSQVIPTLSRARVSSSNTVESAAPLNHSMELHTAAKHKRGKRSSHDPP